MDAEPRRGVAAVAPRPVDPVTEPDAYRRELLRWLGADVPSAVLVATPHHLRRLVAAAGPALRERPAATEWSVIECVGHVLDGELVTGARLRWIIAEDRPDIVGYDQDRWVEGLGHRDDDPDELIDLFATLREANLRLWDRWGALAGARVGIHRERGPESADLIWRLLAGHDRFHLAQAERAVAATRR